MDDIAVRPRGDFPQRARLVFALRRRRNRYYVQDDKGRLWSGDDQDTAVMELEARINGRLLREMAGFLALHAACATINNQRVALVGDMAAGKTTLAAQLVLDGMEVHCDEVVLLDGLEAVPFPRKFHLKQRTLARVPELGPFCAALRPYPFSPGNPLYFFDPSDVKGRWSAAPGRLEALLYLKPRFGSEPTLEACSKLTMSRLILGQAGRFAPDAGRQVKNLVDLVNKSACYLLGVGHPQRTSRAVIDLLS